MWKNFPDFQAMRRQITSQDVKLFTVAERHRSLRSRQGVAIVPDHSFEDCPGLDVLLVPGPRLCFGADTHLLPCNPDLVSRIKVYLPCMMFCSVEGLHLTDKHWDIKRQSHPAQFPDKLQLVPAIILVV